MGKHKGKKSVFKLAGAKSLKPKTKAKPVELKLKKLAPKLKEEVAALDVQLTKIDKLVRKSENEKPVKQSDRQIVLKPSAISAESEQQTLNDLSELQFS